MQLNFLILTAFTAAVGASAIPHELGFTYKNNTLEKKEYGVHCDCKGSIMCATLKVQACDEAVNFKLIRNDAINYGAIGSSAPHHGVCHGIGTDFGCAITIQGHSSCIRTGNDIWWDYQVIRHSGCHHCGHKYWGDGCSTVIDYEPQCGRIH
ncbi:hypothetical protein F5Y11DRAFT_155228 [Daldinia sp. FL1419]|nr:hypothetical protein F5Y11DRAFT_155228 [Daldinia sp. FL1419]